MTTAALKRPALSNTAALFGLVQLLAPSGQTEAPMVETADGPRRAWHAFIANTGEENRHGDIIDQNTWQLDNYRSNAVVLWMHDNYQDPLGRGEVWVEGQGTPSARLMVKIHWNMDRQEARDKCRDVENGFLSAVSIHAAFAQVQWRDELPETDARYKRTGWGRALAYGDLREISLVTVPGDPRALKQALLAALDSPPADPGTPNTPSGESMDLALLRAALGLPADASEEVILSTIKERESGRTALTTAVRGALKLSADAALPDDLTAALAAATDKSGLVTLAEAQALAAVAVQTAQPDQKTLAAQRVQLALQEGKILPAFRETWDKLAAESPAACIAQLDSIGAPVVPLATQFRKDKVVEQSTALSAAEEKQRKSAGLSVEEWQAARQKNPLIAGNRAGMES